MRKTFLLGGIALLLATVSWAGQRSRGGDSIRSGSRSSEAAARAEGREIAPGVVVVNIGGVDSTANAANVVDYAQMLGGLSEAEYLAQEAIAGLGTMPGTDGGLMTAGNHVFILPGFVPDEILPWSIENHDVVGTEMTIGGVSVTTFADNAQSISMDVAAPQMVGTGCLTDGPCADNAKFQE
jgi:hypothetical protein